MTINDIMLKSRNAALYHILYGRNNLRYAYPAAGAGGEETPPGPTPPGPTPPPPGPEPVPVQEPDAMISAINNSTEPEVAVQLAGNLNMDNEPPVRAAEGKTVTVDLAGNKIEASTISDDTTKDAIFAVRRGGKLIINDNGDEPGSVEATADSVYAAIKLTEKGEDPTGEPATIVINGGEFTGWYYAVTGNGSRQNTDVTINGGKFKGVAPDDCFGMYHPQQGELKINGGEFEGSSAIYVKCGTVKVTGGSFKGIGNPQAFKHNKSGAYPTGAAFIVEVCDYPGQAPNVEIRGGDFESVNDKPVASYCQNEDPEFSTFVGERLTHFVYGGRFNKPFSDEDLELIAEGYTQVEDPEKAGWWKVVPAE